MKQTSCVNGSQVYVSHRERYVPLERHVELVNSIEPKYIPRIDFNETAEVRVNFAVPHYVRPRSQVMREIRVRLEGKFKRTDFTLTRGQISFETLVETSLTDGPQVANAIDWYGNMNQNHIED